MKRKSLFINILLILMLSFAIHLAGSMKQPFLIQSEHFVVEKIPLSYDKYGYLPVVDLIIGAQTVHLGIDTGADRVTISLNSSVLEKVQVTFLKSKYSYRDLQGKGEVYEAREFVIPTARIGNLEIINLTGKENVSGYDSTDGFIGNGFLANFNVLMDYPHGRMVLYPKTEDPNGLDLTHWTKLPFQHKNNLGIIVRGRIGAQGKQLKYILDTGCTVHMEDQSMGLIRPKFVAKSELAGTVLIPQLAAEELPYTQTDHFYMGGVDLGATRFLVYDFRQPPVDGFLGHHVFVKYQIFIDFAHQLLFIQKPQ